MPSQKNTQLLEEIKEKLGRAQATYFVDYQGLTHQQMEEARRELKNNASEMAVNKNTLMNIALKEKNIDAEEKLEGPYATLYAYEDPIATARVIYTFFKKYNLPEIKFGILDGVLIEAEIIVKLAGLPSREVLLGKFVSLLNAPISGLVYTLNGNIQKLVLTLKAIESTKGGAQN